MKCTNPIKCDGDTKPLYKHPELIECVKCGFRIYDNGTATKVSRAKKPAPVAEILPIENKGENN